MESLCETPYNSCLAPFKFKKKHAKPRNYFLQQAVTPEQITQKNSFQRAGKP